MLLGGGVVWVRLGETSVIQKILRQTNIVSRQTSVCPFLYLYVLAEVPGAAQVDLQPAVHLLFCIQFSKMSPSAFSVIGPPGPGGRGPGSKLHQNLPCQDSDAGVWISISPPHTNKQTNICTHILYIIED